MRVTKFYKKPENDLKYDKSITSRDKYPLYAIALNKKDAKEFIKTRDMDKFIESTDVIDDDDVSQFMESINKNPSLHVAVLGTYKLKTYIDKYTENMQCPSVAFLMTEREHVQTIENADDSIQILSHMWWDQYASEVKAVQLLKKKYIDALDVLDFSLAKSLILEDQFINDGEDWQDAMNMGFMEWQYDQLLVFMRMYQWSIKIKDKS